MIHPDSRTLPWIEQVAKNNKIKDISLAEKTIRAFSLLEALVRSGCPFLFKGGSSLMLHLDTGKRLSIDIDIICPLGTRIDDHLAKCAKEYGFEDVRLVERISRIGVPKRHAKFFYQVAYPAEGHTDKILLDVLFEEIHYSKIVELPIESHLLKTYGIPMMVRLPSKEDLLGDKLTAFAPHTTGIPFFKGKKDCSMEIIKQLFDISSLFDLIADLSITAATFKKFAMVELQYRALKTGSIQAVLADIYNTALCIVLRGQDNPEEFRLLQEGIKRVRGFIHSEVYNLNGAITDASKAAYLSKLIVNNINEVRHYNPITDSLVGTIIQPPLPTKLNKLKKTNIEAFFYWTEIQKLL